LYLKKLIERWKEINSAKFIVVNSMEIPNESLLFRIVVFFHSFTVKFNSKKGLIINILIIISSMLLGPKISNIIIFSEMFILILSVTNLVIFQTIVGKWFKRFKEDDGGGNDDEDEPEDPPEDPPLTMKKFLEESKDLTPVF